MAVSDQRIATFSPLDVSMIVSQDSSGLNYKVKGFAEDNMITAAPQVDTFTHYTGADNFVTRVHSGNKSGIVTVYLQSSSPTNDVFTALYNRDMALRNGQGIFSLLIKDNSGRGVAYSAQAYIGRLPDFGLQSTIKINEWIIHCTNLKVNFGGNAELLPEDVQALTALGATVDQSWVLT